MEDKCWYMLTAPDGTRIIFDNLSLVENIIKDGKKYNLSKADAIFEIRQIILKTADKIPRAYVTTKNITSVPYFACIGMLDAMMSRKDATEEQKSWRDKAKESHKRASTIIVSHLVASRELHSKLKKYRILGSTEAERATAAVIAHDKCRETRFVLSVFSNTNNKVLMEHRRVPGNEPVIRNYIEFLALREGGRFHEGQTFGCIMIYYKREEKGLVWFVKYKWRSDYQLKDRLDPAIAHKVSEILNENPLVIDIHNPIDGKMDALVDSSGQ